VDGDRRVTFRLYAPDARAVSLTSADMPGNERGAALTKGDDGIWQVTLGPVEAGAYRYNFNTDNTPVIDPRNPSVSESNNNVWSLVYIPGADFMDVKDVSHGGVTAVHYYSKALSKWRRMHVYTPPGYELGQGKYPVLYLLHGGNDSDDSWPSVGRAGFIVDNLVASRKAKPMIVVMPAGQTSRTANGAAEVDDFGHDFLTDIMPYIETHYRVYTDRPHRAIAGLSVGGLQTLYISIPHIKHFGYVGVFSSALVTLVPGRPPQGGPAPVAAWEAQHLAELDNHSAQEGLKLLWFKTGVDDRNVSIASTQATADMLNKHGFKAVFEQSPGGHTWLNWRNYLNEFAPQLFQ
jgi:enterochelin esterase family protein